MAAAANGPNQMKQLFLSSQTASETNWERKREGGHKLGGLFWAEPALASLSDSVQIRKQSKK